MSNLIILFKVVHQFLAILRQFVDCDMIFVVDLHGRIDLFSPFSSLCLDLGEKSFLFGFVFVSDSLEVGFDICILPVEDAFFFFDTCFRLGKLCIQTLEDVLAGLDRPLNLREILLQGSECWS